MNKWAVSSRVVWVTGVVGSKRQSKKIRDFYNQRIIAYKNYGV